MSDECSAHDLAHELWVHRHDADEWAEEEETVEVRPAGTAVVSSRLPQAEFRALRAAAQVAQESLSEYVRAAILARLGTPPAQQEPAPQRQPLAIQLRNTAVSADDLWQAMQRRDLLRAG
jgi:hypothetical protein